ncbi:hypothetical protein SAMN04488103_101233 [Gemmobacter aquatilis]|uniref:Flagellar export protein FliJ n=1 Tax=Gemmobacter aquatilis TaxID=933059 RepID=A0A1H7YL25_9RHOB|nr:hypothetical protein [Gemmobacter aquatilis]SEM46830.1 hypothetical protein SAMN04488103_101233 [Gemmobacter aquatilis]
MKDRAKLRALQGIAALMKDQRLAQLHQAAEARAKTLARLDGLAVPAAVDLPLVSAAQVTLGYQRWADLRRSELNLMLARQTADWMERQAEARLAFGKADALGQLAEKRR